MKSFKLLSGGLAASLMVLVTASAIAQEAGQWTMTGRTPDLQRYSPLTAINKANVRKYSKSGALTAYREFPGRTHNTIGQAGWEQVADFALSWALENSHYQITDDDVKAAFAPPPVRTESGEHEIRM